MSTYICKCGRRVKKSTNADNTGNRLEGYGPGHECYDCPYVLSWGTYKWNEETKSLEQKTKGYECRMSKTLAYDSRFIGSTKDKCTCSVVSLDFGFLEQISAWVKETFTLGELTGHFSRDKIRATEYCHNGRYQYALYCAQNKKGIAAKAALFEHFFNPDGSRKDMTPQQEMEKVLTDIKKAKEAATCATAQNAGAAATTAERVVSNAAAETLTTSESAADASASTQEASIQSCELGPTVSVEDSSASPQDKPLNFLPENTIPEFDYSGLPEQAVENLHFAENEYRHGKQMAERGLVHMGNAIAAAHDELCTVVAQCDNGRFAKKEDTFRAWCLSIGITKDSAYRLLQVSALMAGSSPRQLAILESLPPTLLYAVAKPSAPPELVEKVKNGEVPTNKAYQDLLKENQQLRTDRVNAMNQAEREKQRADTAEAQRDAAQADVAGLHEQNTRLKEQVDAAEAREEEAWKLQGQAVQRAKDAEGRLEGSRQVAEAAKLRADKYKAEAEAARKVPIEAVVMDEDEAERRINQQAHAIAEDLAADMTAEYKERQEQDARSAYDSILLAGRSLTNTWQIAKPALCKLPPEQREAAANQLIHTLGQIQGEVSQCL